MARYSRDERESNLTGTRIKLLEAAVREFARRGFDNANINTISESAGLGKGTVYNYFPSKRILMLAAIAEVSGRHHEYLLERVTAESEPLARLQAFYEAGFQFVVEHSDQARFLIGTMYGGSQEEFKQAIYSEYRWMAELIRGEILDYGKRKGFFQIGEPAVVTGMLMTLYLGNVAAVDENGKPFMKAGDVYAFAARSFQQPDHGRMV